MRGKIGLRKHTCGLKGTCNTYWHVAATCSGLTGHLDVGAPKVHPRQRYNKCRRDSHIADTGAAYMYIYIYLMHAGNHDPSLLLYSLEQRSTELCPVDHVCLFQCVNFHELISHFRVTRRYRPCLIAMSLLVPINCCSGTIYWGNRPIPSCMKMQAHIIERSQLYLLDSLDLRYTLSRIH